MGLMTGQIDLDPKEKPRVSNQIVTLCFFRFEGLTNKLWAFAQMGLARIALARLPGLGFFKLMGAGTGEGFTPVPDTGAVAVLTTWPDIETARRQIETAPVFRRYRAHAAEVWVVHLAPRSVWGEWAGRQPFVATPAPLDGPVVALTRATVKPTALLRFWRRVPDISGAIGTDPNVLFKVGVGEVPWVHQMTFSIWPDTDTMAAFARADGPHARAIRAVRAGNWFREELYARFAVVDSHGTWRGRDPLAGPAQARAAQGRPAQVQAAE